MPFRSLSRELACGLLALGLVTAVSAAVPEAIVKEAEPDLNRSIFIDNPKAGKDPFFPDSKRRPGTNTNESAIIPVRDEPTIKVQGISGTKENRLVILNNRTFEEGEEAELKVDGQAVRVRCVEIRARTIVIQINGQPPQELPLFTTPRF